MNNQTKIILTIQGIAGSTFHKEVVNTVKFLRKKDLPNYKGSNGNDIVRKFKVKSYNVVPVDCSKSIKMTYDAYAYMTGKEKPEWYYKKDWLRLSSKDRLELHLARICEHNNGTTFSYSILEDE